MKYISFTFFALTCLVGLLSSCAQNDLQINTSETPLQFKMSLREGRASIKSVDNELAGMAIHLFTFKSGSAGKAEFHLTDTFESLEVELSYIPDAAFERSDKYDVFIIGFKDDVLLAEALKNKDITLDELKMLGQGKISDINTQSKSYAVSGGLIGVNFNNPAKTIMLVRDVARLELEIEDNTSSYSNMEVHFDAPNSTYVFPSDIRENMDLPSGMSNIPYKVTLSQDLVVTNKFTGSIYFFEKQPNPTSLVSTDKLILTINAVRTVNSVPETVMYRIALNAGNSFTTERNTIYKVKASLDFTGIEIKSNTSIDWTATVDDVQDVLPL